MGQEIYSNEATKKISQKVVPVIVAALVTRGVLPTPHVS